MRRLSFPLLGIVLALAVCELLLSFAARVSPRIDYLLTPPWNRTVVEDPVLRVRGSAFAAGHDANGFRNTSVPDDVDIVAVGDSMTYGYAASAGESWPSQLESLTGLTVYNMSFGGYCPWQYEILIQEGLELDPEWVVVGLFVGNDFSECYRDVWLGDRARGYRSHDPSVAREIAEADRDETLADRAARLIEDGGVVRPDKPSGGLRGWISDHSALYGLARELKASLAGERWEIERRDSFEAALGRPHRLAFDAYPNFRTVFLRPEALGMRVDFDDPRIREGKRIVEEVLLSVREDLESRGVRLAVAVIPSKQVVYAEVIRESQVAMGDAFWEAVFKEQVLTSELMDFLRGQDFLAVEVLASLRSRFGGDRSPYPEWDDEHPNGEGYRAIAEAVAEAIAPGEPAAD